VRDRLHLGIGCAISYGSSTKKASGLGGLKCKTGQIVAWKKQRKSSRQPIRRAFPHLPTHFAFALPAIESILAISVAFPLAEADSEPGILKVSYIFRNLRTQTVLVRGFGLVELFGHSDDIDNQNSLSLCNGELTNKRLLALNVMRGLPLPGGLYLRLPFNVIGDEHLSASIYDPTQIMVEDAQAKEPISIDGGKNKIVVSTFKLNSGHLKNTTNFWVLCPFVNAVDTTGHSASSVCPGYAHSIINNGITNKRDGPNEQFRILPLATQWACPVADQ
jgi:hypothetical protein